MLVTFTHGDAATSTSDRFTTNGMIDGLIRLYAAGEPAPPAAAQVPAVTVGLDAQAHYDLVTNEARGIEIAVEHLYRLGHDRIGLVCEPPSHPEVRGTVAPTATRCCGSASRTMHCKGRLLTITAGTRPQHQRLPNHCSHCRQNPPSYSLTTRLPWVRTACCVPCGA